MFEQSEEQERGFAAQAVVPEEVALLDVGLEGVPVPSAAPDAGCPIMMQTAPGIKMLTQVPKADVSVNLPGLVRFTLAHFADLALLKDYLESRESPPLVAQCAVCSVQCMLPNTAPIRSQCWVARSTRSSCWWRRRSSTRWPSTCCCRASTSTSTSTGR